MKSKEDIIHQNLVFGSSDMKSVKNSDRSAPLCRRIYNSLFGSCKWFAIIDILDSYEINHYKINSIISYFQNRQTFLYILMTVSPAGYWSVMFHRVLF